MDFLKVRVIEFLALRTPLPVRDVCSVLEAHFRLPRFTMAAEPEGESGAVEVAGIEYCVSRPAQSVMLPEWAELPTVDCNVGVTVLIGEDQLARTDAERGLGDLIPRIAQSLADALVRPIIHCGTMFLDGRCIRHDRAFRPSSFYWEKPA